MALRTETIGQKIPTKIVPPEKTSTIPSVRTPYEQKPVEAAASNTINSSLVKKTVGNKLAEIASTNVASLINKNAVLLTQAVTTSPEPVQTVITTTKIVTPEREKKEIKIPTVTLDFSGLERYSGIGKKLISVENNSFGPPLAQVSNNYFYTQYGFEFTDIFRIKTGSYWTTTPDGKNIYFLSRDESINGLHEFCEILDFDLLKFQKTKLTDFYGLSTSEPSVKSLVTNLNKLIVPKAQSQYATQQWVLVKTKIPQRTQSTINQIVQTAQQTVSGLSSVVPLSKPAPSISSIKATLSQGSYKAGLAGGTKTLLGGTGNSPTKNSSPSQSQQTTSTSPTVVTYITQENVIYSDPIIKEGAVFYDHSYEISLPFSSGELKKIQSFIAKPLEASLNPVYNFYIQEYEKTVDAADQIEPLLPNLYAMVLGVDRLSKNTDIQTQITLSNLIKEKILPVTPVEKNLNVASTIKQQITGNYFIEYAKTLKLVNTPERPIYIVPGNNKTTSTPIAQTSILKEKENLQRVKSKFANIAFTLENIDILKNQESKKYLFPMYFEIQFATDKTTSVAEILKESKLSTAIQKRIMNNNFYLQGFTKEPFMEATELLTFQKSNVTEANIKVQKKSSVERKERNVWDITDWLAEYDVKNQTSGETIDPQKRKEILSLDKIDDIGVFFDNGLGEIINESEQTKFYRQFLKLIFVGKLRKLIKKKFRTFEELMRGKLAYSETILYKVEKYKASSTNKPFGEPLQNFYFPNSNEIDVLKFIDTQVKYNTNYFYRVVAYQVVIGTKYEYSDLMTLGSYSAFLVTQYPSIKLVEIPIFEEAKKIIDSPPVFPEVEPIPYRGINNKVLFFLRSNVGSYTMEPILIDSEDQLKFDEYRKAKGLEADESIDFATDDHTGIFQIFRIEGLKPTSYEDFSGKMLAVVETDISKLTLQSATSAAYVDDIKPNTKYYYTFRIVDNHGHLSNPSPVYEIEMVDERGTVYFLFNVVDFEKKGTSQKNSRAFRRYMKIAPSMSQIIINEEKSGLSDGDSALNTKRIFLGVEDETLWGKKFKIRLTSKSTGKVIDINLECNTVDNRMFLKNM